MTKYLYKWGDRRDLYLPGEETRMKWGVTWVIVMVKYDATRDRTAIKLCREGSAGAECEEE